GSRSGSAADFRTVYSEPSGNAKRLDMRRFCLLGLADAAPDLFESPAQLGLEAALGWLIEAVLLHPLRHQRLPGEPSRLVVGIDIAGPAPQLAGTRVVGIAQVVGRRLGAVLAHIGARGADRPIGGV